ncbi:hypothetical protein SNE510_75250 [Streptomyces sp. NE5-10]|uniref:hypothetical protein n=1 Tax=Streptomyces sp. NE5-10 TaxID=2759674 RepID=UPI001905C042|nr:hypothetical protein [Streptomyces sp. NE5-10]GHJ98006.1 hypothetical protein SNE510_75250 [Streptomyces sp. NE5-10]
MYRDPGEGEHTEDWGRGARRTITDYEPARGIDAPSGEERSCARADRTGEPGPGTVDHRLDDAAPGTVEWFTEQRRRRDEAATHAADSGADNHRRHRYRQSHGHWAPASPAAPTAGT